MPAGHLGRARLWFWGAGFPQSGPAVSEKAVPKAGGTGRLGTLELVRARGSYGNACRGNGEKRLS